ncbi:MAG: agmatine deiminase [Faecalibacterium sp.]
MILHTTPAADGFRMPAEYEPHRGCMMIWPVRPGSWPHGGAEAQRTFAQVARAIAESEQVWMLAAPEQLSAVQTEFAADAGIHVLSIATNDAWARDVGPTCVVDGMGRVRGVDWQFNAWGGTVDGLYAHWEKDNAAARALCAALELDCYDAQHFVLEGGSIHTDGEGTVLATEACLLSAGRNPQLTRQQIEQELCRYLGAEKVVWLPRGIWNDETNEHIDNVCAFVGPAEVVLAWTEDENDPQYALSLASLRALEQAVDAKGRRFTVHKLPVPNHPVCITQQELEGFDFEEGEDQREAEERLAASYVNFYLSNGGVILPQFGDENDDAAVQLLGQLFPTRKIYPIPARSILVGGGNIHCITQQIPAGRNNDQEEAK